MSEEDLEQLLYQRLCRGCLNEKQCHDTCEYCEEYLGELEK